MNNKGVFNPLLLVWVGVGLVIIGIALASMNNSKVITPGQGVARDFVCDVGIDEESAVLTGGLVTTGVGFKSVDCRVTKLKNSCGLFSLALFRESGKVSVLDSRGVIASKDFETSVFGGDITVSLSGCTIDNSLTFRIVDEEGNLQDGEEVLLI